MLEILLQGQGFLEEIASLSALQLLDENLAIVLLVFFVDSVQTLDMPTFLWAKVVLYHVLLQLFLLND